MMVKQSVPKNNIVIGFQSPYARGMMDEFAVA